jgi:hypothetical protein
MGHDHEPVQSSTQPHTLCLWFILAWSLISFSVILAIYFLTKRVASSIQSTRPAHREFFDFTHNSRWPV